MEEEQLKLGYKKKKKKTTLRTNSKSIEVMSMAKLQYLGGRQESQLDKSGK